MIDILIYPGSILSSRFDALADALRLEGFRAVRQPSTDTFGKYAVLYVWTEEDLPNTASFDAATETLAFAKRLVSVRLGAGDLPNALPDHPQVDLSGWRGSIKDERFQCLVSMLRAADRQEMPAPTQSGWKHLIWKACGGLTATAVILFLLSIPFRVLELQNNLCSIGWPQPTLSDFCGEHGLGGKPKKEERIAWESREPGSCEALRSHIDRFPNGALYARAAAALEARRVDINESWIPETSRNIFSQSFAPEGADTMIAAREGALASGRRWAEESCRAHEASDFYRFLSVDLEVEQWDCLSLRSGHYCGFDGYRICHFESLERTELETCGLGP
ncbi:hypothetical protein SAMN05428995_102521 [Loktanella sp. DSM 29012]|uniref:hypothetical protein n=1 Tax=Loktanella sp. DSM 29012 TaxID=1881056 RepID=UPI0008D3C273|nr:hypothetical protein [Loktanella sp. DSM 29012]SEQ07666.1 hypothetical protein SAMN05428995_102521 [Loktanella sp. DSM 29012]